MAGPRLVLPVPQFVIGTNACPGLRSGMRLNGFPLRQRPPVRHSREGGNPRTNIPRKIAYRDTTTHVHTAAPTLGLPYRPRRTPPPPALVIAMKACPGLRSGIDCSGSLSFAICCIPSPIRPPIRHSGEGRNPEGWGEGNVARSKTSRGEGLVPRWGWGGALQNPPCRLAVPNHNS